MMVTMATIRRRIGAVIGRMTKEDAISVLARIRTEDGGPRPTIFHATIREITGGYNSQAINGHVIRKLGIKAGIIKEMK